MPEIQYGEQRVLIPNDDGTWTIFSNGYYDGPRSIVEQTREDIRTSEASLLTDVIKCLELLKTDTPELVISIKKDRYGKPHLISKLWTVNKKKLR